MNRILPMIWAETLKLRKRRGLFWFSMIATVGLVVVANAIIFAYHLSNPALYGSPAGDHAFLDALNIFGIITVLVPVVIGATAGSQDVESGVFRSLVSTGRSRISLALVRIPGALLFVAPMVLAAYVIQVAICAVPDSSVTALNAGDVLTGLGWLAAATLLNTVLALGVAALTGARGTAIGVIIVWQILAGHLIERITAFGAWRGLVSSVALDRFMPGATDTVRLTRLDSITVTTGMALAVVIGWIVVTTALGVWRTAVQDA